MKLKLLTSHLVISIFIPFLTALNHSAEICNCKCRCKHVKSLCQVALENLPLTGVRLQDGGRAVPMPTRALMMMPNVGRATVVRNILKEKKVI